MGLLLVGLALYGNWLLLVVVPAVAWLAIMLFYWWVPEHWYYQSRLMPVLSWRLTSLMRMTFITLVFCSLAWLTVLLGRWAVLYYATLWWLPLNATFTLFMLFRHLVQHGNGGQTPATCTRNVATNWLVRWLCFPLGQERHATHHLHPGVPHFQLGRLAGAAMPSESNLLAPLRRQPTAGVPPLEDRSVLTNETLLPLRMDG
jgi:fatty acid desaturase